VNTVVKAAADKSAQDALDNLILTEYPYPIAVNYRILLDAGNSEQVTRKALAIFEDGLRITTLCLLNQYLVRDAEAVTYRPLDETLQENLPRATLGQLREFLFLCLEAYKGKRNRFFMPELYDFYWDTSVTPQQQRVGVKEPFARLTDIRNDLAHGMSPQTGAKKWDEIAAEVLPLLRTVLGHFAFLKDYDLIQVLDLQDDELQYQQFTGEEVTRHRRRLHGNEAPIKGHIYLVSQSGALLELHPLLVYWSDDEDQLSVNGQQDAAVFSRLSSREVQYFASVQGEKVVEDDPDLLAQVRQLIYYNLGQIKIVGARPELSWTELRRVAEELSRQKMEAVASKYDTSLYLQRNETLRQFQEFLSSDKGCFVLTGKSGVGKTNFILSLVKELAASDDVCFLLHNGARLQVQDTMAKTITDDFTKYLILKPGAKQNLFEQLERQREVVDRYFVIVFDAINENANGRALLQRIDQMVGQVHYPWLKVVITSRPQAWRALRRGLKLAEERYFRPPGSETYEVELKEFTVQLDPFRREELPVVYEKYQNRFGLKTPYEALAYPIREALRDPLTLRLVAQIHRDREIPKQLQVGGICRQYVDALRTTEQLEGKDLVLLERDLMPFMISEGHYDNKVTEDQISSTDTPEGRRLWELLFNEERLSDGKPINESYMRLADNEILATHVTLEEYEIVFKYERFYDYYGGRRLRTLLKEKQEAKERAAAYQDFISMYQQKKPYLWGVVHSALMDDLGEGRTDLISELAQTIDQPTKDLIVSVLTTYGQDHVIEARVLCHQLLDLGEPQKRTGPLSAFRSIAAQRKKAKSTAPGDAVTQALRSQSLSGIHMAKKATIEVAFNLQLEDVLVRAACDAASPTRAVAMQYIYYLWLKDPTKGFAVIDTIGQQIVVKGIVPDTRALESCMGISLMILFWHYKDLDKRQQYFRRLQEIWKAPIEHMLFLSETDGQALAGLKSVVRVVILRFFTSLVARVLGKAEEASVMFSLGEVRAFFPPNDQEKRLLREFIPHMDAVHGGCDSITTIQPHLVEVLQDRELLTSYVPFLAIVSHALVEPKATLAVLKQLFQIAMDNPPPVAVAGASPAGPMVQVLVWSVRNMMYGNRFAGSDLTGIEIPLDALEAMAGFIQCFEDRYESRCSTTLREYRLNEIGSYTYFYHRAYDDPQSDLLNYLVDKAIREKDLDALLSYISTMAGQGTHPAWAIPRAALQVLHLILRRSREMDLDNDARGRVDEALVAAFSNIRAYHADVVDDFLAELTDVEMAPDMKRAIQNRGATESLGMLLGTAGAWFARDILVDEDPYMRNFLKWLLYRAIECRSFGEWVGPLIKQLINIVYGKPVFRVPA
jgi:hypothetical protein